MSLVLRAISDDLVSEYGTDVFISIRPRTPSLPTHLIAICRNNPAKLEIYRISANNYVVGIAGKMERATTPDQIVARWKNLVRWG